MTNFEGRLSEHPRGSDLERKRARNIEEFRLQDHKQRNPQVLASSDSLLEQIKDSFSNWPQEMYNYLKCLIKDISREMLAKKGEVQRRTIEMNSYIKKYFEPSTGGFTRDYDTSNVYPHIEECLEGLKNLQESVYQLIASIEGRGYADIISLTLEGESNGPDPIAQAVSEDLASAKIVSYSLKRSNTTRWRVTKLNDTIYQFREPDSQKDLTPFQADFLKLVTSQNRLANLLEKTLQEIWQAYMDLPHRQELHRFYLQYAGKKGKLSEPLENFDDCKPHLMLASSNLPLATVKEIIQTNNKKFDTCLKRLQKEFWRVFRKNQYPN